MIEITQEYTNSYIYKLFSRIETVTRGEVKGNETWDLHFETGEIVKVRSDFWHNATEFKRQYIKEFLEPPVMEFLKKDFDFFCKLVGEKLKESEGIEGAGIKIIPSRAVVYCGH